MTLDNLRPVLPSGAIDCEASALYVQEALLYLKTTSEVTRAQWTQFNIPAATAGLLLMLLATVLLVTLCWSLLCVSCRRTASSSMGCMASPLVHRCALAGLFLLISRASWSFSNSIVLAEAQSTQYVGVSALAVYAAASHLQYANFSSFWCLSTACSLPVAPFQSPVPHLAYRVSRQVSGIHRHAMKSAIRVMRMEAWFWTVVLMAVLWGGSSSGPCLTVTIVFFCSAAFYSSWARMPARWSALIMAGTLQWTLQSMRAPARALSLLCAICASRMHAWNAFKRSRSFVQILGIMFSRICAICYCSLLLQFGSVDRTGISPFQKGLEQYNSPGRSSLLQRQQEVMSGILGAEIFVSSWSHFVLSYLQHPSSAAIAPVLCIISISRKFSSCTLATLTTNVVLLESPWNALRWYCNSKTFNVECRRSRVRVDQVDLLQSNLVAWSFSCR